jgi:uncharacterized protein
VADRAGIVLITGGIRLYQLFISQYFTGSCRFLPSCSEYARQALTTHGVARGGCLAVRRLARCHPLCSGGHDPVPGSPASDAGFNLR